MNEDENSIQDPSPTPEAPADALSRTPEELEDAVGASESAPEAPEEEKGKPKKDKKPSALRKWLRELNIYFLLFLLVLIIAAVIATVTYLNSQKDPAVPATGTQELSQEALQQLANTDTSVGDNTQTLTIQGNAIIDGQTLMRGNLNIAGNLQTGGSIQGPSITISGTSNLGTAQINSLQVAGNTAIEGSTSMRDLSVAGTSTFNGAMTASQITVSRLIMSGNASLEIPNHIAFTGPAPNRTVNQAQLGSGGSASVSGSDTTGTININIGNNPAAGCMVRVNFNQQYTRPPRVLITPIGNAAGRTQHYVERDQSGFSVCTATPAPANQSFAFDYFVTG